MSAPKRIIIRQNARRGGGSSRGRGPFFKSYASTALWIGLTLLLAGSVSAIGLYAWISRDLPDPNKVNQRNIAQTTRIYDRTGEHLLYEVHGDQKRTVVELDDIAEDVRHATISAEDRDFYSHGGFSVTGFIRAAITDIRTGTRAQGGSTITQQFVKNSILTKEKTFKRKIKELILSIAIERQFTKDQILKLYLNEIPYGSVAYGIESASQTFLGKSAKDLTLSESAFLASLPKAPTYYSPYGTHTDDLVARSHFIIDGMVQEGYATAEEAEIAKQDDVLSRVQPRRENIVAPHFIFYVKELLADQFGESDVERGGLKVLTTLDFDDQTAAEKAVADNIENIKKWGGTTAALVALDPRNGDILSMVGSADYFDEEIDGNFNAVLGKLQPGSSIKPIVYAAAFERGFTPNTVLYDVETEFSDGATSYRPKNYDLKQNGPVTIREALGGSLNIPAVKTLYLTGLNYFSDFSKKFGYTTLTDTSKFGLSLVLGGAEVVPLEHINAFGIFAQDGVYRAPRAILKVEDIDGKTLYQDDGEVQGKRVIDQEVSRQINGILTDNSARAWVFGEQNYLTLGGRPVGAKTGTTNSNKDAWAIGYTPSLVAGVWVGNADGTLMKAGADGSIIAAPLWNAFMRAALEGSPIETFPEDIPVVTGKPVLDGEKNAQMKIRIDTATGKLATEYTPADYIEERGFGIPHDILFFVDPADPRGPAPEHPENDPQFARWEQAVAEWVIAQGDILPVSTAPPPTDYDDVHVPENFPSVSFAAPRDGQTLTDRSVDVRLDASARRGVAKIRFLMDGEQFAEHGWPLRQPIVIPNRFSKGFHTFTAIALDDVGNSGSTNITINLNAGAGPIGVEWITPNSYDTVYSSQFPFTVRFTIEDIRSVRQLRVIARETGFIGREYDIGSIDNPALPNMSLQWNDVPQDPGQYMLLVRTELVTGEIKEEGIPVHIAR